MAHFACDKCDAERVQFDALNAMREANGVTPEPRKAPSALDYYATVEQMPGEESGGRG